MMMVLRLGLLGGLLSVCGVTVFGHSAKSVEACPRVFAPARFPHASEPTSINGFPINAGIKPSGFVDLADGTPVVHGVDVSKYQDEVDFKSVYDCGGRFAFVRLSGGTDPDNELLYRTHWANVRNARLIPGPYHNLGVLPSEAQRLAKSTSEEIDSATNSLLPAARETGRAQARIFLSRLNELTISETTNSSPGKPYLPAALDLSYRPFPNGDAAQKLAYGKLYSATICSFIAELRKSSYGNNPVILFVQPQDYLSYGLSEAECDLSREPIWVRYRPLDGDRFTKSLDKSLVEKVCNVGGRDRCIMEQYTSYGGFAIFKTGAPLDASRFFGTEMDLSKLLIGG
jgi:hypothetical protein